jgi:hypothetical protein
MEIDVHKTSIASGCDKKDDRIAFAENLIKERMRDGGARKRVEMLSKSLSTIRLEDLMEPYNI